MCVWVCVSGSVLTPVWLWVTAPFSPFFFLPIVSGWAWQSRPDKWTQIASGDRWRRSVYFPSIAPHVLSIARVWWRQGCMMDGWMPESISFKCSLRSVAPSHFFSSLCFISLSFCRLYHFVIWLNAVFLSVFLSRVPYFKARYYQEVRREVFICCEYCWEKHTSSFLSENGWSCCHFVSLSPNLTLLPSATYKNN